MTNLRSGLARIAGAMLIGLSCMATSHAESSFRELKWDDLIPDDEKAMASAAARGDSLDDLLEQASPPLQSSTLVESLNNQAVRLPGFIVPIESDEVGLLSEFFLVPYFGACIHVPPPPPNQLVYVKLSEPFELTSLWDPFWVSGTLKTQGFESDMGQAGYTLELGAVAPYEWPQ